MSAKCCMTVVNCYCAVRLRAAEPRARVRHCPRGQAGAGLEFGLSLSQEIERLARYL